MRSLFFVWTGIVGAIVQSGSGQVMQVHAFTLLTWTGIAGSNRPE
jgi:hypothetical protein